jgi:hypothetical protein
VPFTVQVRVTTDASKTVVATSDPCGSKAPIELDLFGPYNNTYFATANAGIATFSITIPNANPGDYSLFAYGPPFDSESGGPAAPASCANTYFVPDEGPSSCEGPCGVGMMAVFIPAGAPIAPCPRDTSCVQTSSGLTQATLIAPEGSQWNPKGTGGYWGPVVSGLNQCGITAPTGDPNGVLSYSLGNTPDGSPGVIILAIDPRGQGVGQFNVCWTQSSAFTTASGAQSPPSGGGFTGDLPACKQRDQMAPCIVSKTGGSGGGTVFLTVLATASLDPRLYGH